MGLAASSDVVDAETLPLKILLREEVDPTRKELQEGDDEKEWLRGKNYQLRHEKNFWRDYARELEKEKKELQDSMKDLQQAIFFGSLSIKSPCTQWHEKVPKPDMYGRDKKWYQTNCPCCRRPLEITLGPLEEESRQWSAWSSRNCYSTCLWGANAGYALGALVLGARLRELSPDVERVLMHTDDVPSNYLEAFSKDGLWQLKQVDYIDGVADLYVSKGNIFDGVFTKLAAWKLEDFGKVLLLDLDIIPLKPMDELFHLRCPAAMVRGQGEETHGAEVDGRRFFGGEDTKDYPWGQTGGINAGLILLEPNGDVFKQMVSEVTCKCHPCHVAGNGPEQDYLSRFFAARRETPWHQISVAWNYQLHQSLFAIERVLQWKVFMDKSKKDFSEADKEWLPQRLRMGVEDIGMVHFSGEVKMWHRFLLAPSGPGVEDRRREVCHSVTGSDADDEAFAKDLLSIQRGHALWVSRTAAPEDYEEHGCRREGDRIFVGEQDVTKAMEWMVQRVVEVAVHSTKVWRECYEKVVYPGLLEELQKPRVPEGCYDLGTQVEVSWTMGQGSRMTVRWLPAKVLAVHDNKDYVVRFNRGGDWGDTERHVHPVRVRLPELENSE